MGLPNIITLVRIILTPAFVRLYLEGEHTAAMVLLGIAAVSDLLDGAIARRFNMITPLGKVLDPVADKLLQLAMLLCLIRRSPAVLPLLLLHVLRELGLFLLGLLAYRRSGLLLGAKWYGKLCTVVIYLSMFILILWKEPAPLFVLIDSIVIAALVALSFVKYFIYFTGILREARKHDTWDAK